MLRAVVGTAGHIDHGKTSLLEALTGVDCDRWAEEKKRGITIDLGFTHLALGDVQIGFVDVPGHEKFLHNALAGLGGIRLVMLVVAADEGVELQTREHLAICQLLEIPRCVVALTKIDLVDEDTRELAELEVAELLESTPYDGAPILPVSSVSKEGLEELKGRLVQEARDGAITSDVRAPLRLPIDRAFQLRGLGAVVTGTLVQGRVEAGQSVDVLPRGVTARVRSVQVHGEERSHAEAGERTAVQLVGASLDDLGRGEQLIKPGTCLPTTRLAARLRLLPDAPEALGGWREIRFHLYAGEVTGRVRSLAPADQGGKIEPGAEGLVELRLEGPMVAVRGDRFILRRPSPAATLGGGIILDPAWRRRRGAELQDATGRLTDEDEVLALWVAESGERGVSADELEARLGRRAADIAKALDARVSEGKLLRLPAGKAPRYITPAVVDKLQGKAKGLLKEHFAENRLSSGMPKAELTARLLPERARPLAAIYLKMLAGTQALVVQGDTVTQPGRKASSQLTGDEQKLSGRLLEAIEAEGLTPPSPAEFAMRLGTKPQILEGVQTYLVRQGKLVRLPSGLILSQKAIDGVLEELASGGWESFPVPRFKDHFGLSRKWAIPLLEHLDSIGATRRVGNERQLVRRG